MNLKLSCIGSGNMGCSLMKGAAAFLNPKQIAFSDAVLSKAEEAAAALGGCFHASNSLAVEEGDIIFLAVKPQVMELVLKNIAPALEEKQKKTGKALPLVSMAAGWTIKRIKACLGPEASRAVKIVRIMPNTPALVGRGVIALSADPGSGEEHVTVLEKILSAAGLVDRVDESYLDAVTGLCGSGPAFVYMFIEALADGGVKAGLSREKALRYAAQTVLGSATMVLETGKHPGELKDMVASPGGTTIEGITALENMSFRAAAINAVEAAWQRAIELSSIS